MKANWHLMTEFRTKFLSLECDPGQEKGANIHLAKPIDSVHAERETSPAGEVPRFCRALESQDTRLSFE